MKIAIITSLLAKRDMKIDAGHNYIFKQRC
jgi:hypothetical protein